MNAFRRKPETIEAFQVNQQLMESHVDRKEPLPLEAWTGHSVREADGRFTVASIRVPLPNDRRLCVDLGQWVVRCGESISVLGPDEFASKYEAL